MGREGLTPPALPGLPDEPRRKQRGQPTPRRELMLLEPVMAVGGIVPDGWRGGHHTGGLLNIARQNDRDGGAGSSSTSGGASTAAIVGCRNAGYSSAAVAILGAGGLVWRSRCWITVPSRVTTSFMPCSMALTFWNRRACASPSAG